MFNVGDVIKLNNNSNRGRLSIGDEFIVLETSEDRQKIKQISGNNICVGKIWNNSTDDLQEYDKID